MSIGESSAVIADFAVDSITSLVKDFDLRNNALPYPVIPAV